MATSRLPIVLLIFTAISYIYLPNANGQMELLDPSLIDPAELQSLLNRVMQEDGVLNPSLLLHEVVEDPLPVPDLNISSSGTFTQIDGQLRNAKLLGLRALQIKKIQVNLGQMKADVEMVVPALRLEGDYQLEGYLTFVNIDGGGQFWMNLTDFRVTGGTTLERGPDGLKVRALRADANVTDIELHFENLLGGGGWSTVSNALLNQLSGVIFDQARDTALDQLRDKVRTEIETRLREIPPQLLTEGSNDTLVDEMLTMAAEYMELLEVEPMQLPDLDQTFRRRFYFLETTGTLRLHGGMLHGLSTLHRTGDISLLYENDTLALVVCLGFRNLTGNYQWNAHLMGVGPTGSLVLSLDNLSMYMSVQLELRTGKRPQILDLKVDRIGQVWLDVQGLGTLDYLLEVIINLMSNALKHNVAAAALSPVREAVQFQLDNFPMEFITA